MSYDVKCLVLADQCLVDHPQFKDKAPQLAQRIQDAIEDWIEYEYEKDR